MTRKPNPPPPQSGGKNLPQVIEGHAEILPPAPLAKIDLRDAHAIRRELGAVYRDMRAGQIETQEGTRLAYVLDMIRKAYDTAVLQERLELLEFTLKHRRSEP